MYRIPDKRRDKPCRFRNLTGLEISVICNGCGGKGGFFNPPDYCFTASCNHHDFNYFLGGDDMKRRMADAKYLGAMLHDARFKPMYQGGAVRPWIVRTWLRGVAYRYYRAVRAGGGKRGAWLRRKLAAVSFGFLGDKNAKSYFNYYAWPFRVEQWSRVEHLMEAADFDREADWKD